jgi:hypothetical protein
LAPVTSAIVLSLMHSILGAAGAAFNTVRVGGDTAAVWIR